MTLHFIGLGKEPAYLAVSSDIVDNKIAGATVIGQKVLLTDTGAWKIIIEDLTLIDYVLPSA